MNFEDKIENKFRGADKKPPNKKKTYELEYRTYWSGKNNTPTKWKPYYHKYDSLKKAKQAVIDLNKNGKYLIVSEYRLKEQ